MAMPLPMSPAPMMPTVRTAAASLLPSAALGDEEASSSSCPRRVSNA